ncbi:MAG: DUF4340 domain-containing protein [Chloroflexi bacterium]|nr:DUF4340 domain-containing protein [Chloroflexota bacterium]
MRRRNILILVAILVVLGGYFGISRWPKAKPPSPPAVNAWAIDRADLARFSVRLTRDARSATFVQAADSTWHFDDAGKSPTDPNRWGGIPLLLNGPKTERIIARDASPDLLAKFGLTQPQMTIVLTLKNGAILNIAVGDQVPNGSAFYLRVPNSNDVATVDNSWFVVFQNLVENPPLAPQAPGAPQPASR